MIRVLVSRQSRYPADTKFLKNKIISLLKSHRVVDGEVSVALVGIRKMKDLAKKFLGEENGVHEVLSFPYMDTSPAGLGQVPEATSDTLQLGDIVICYPEARKIAMRRNRMMDDVLAELAEHATLHLLGIHHED